MQYDEDRELTQYVWKHFSRLMTDFEQRVGITIMGREKAAMSKHPQAVELLYRRQCGLDDGEINAALADGAESFRRRVRDRLLSECGRDVFINRCPRCARVVRTPRARQCFWCGFDWHHQGRARKHSQIP